MLTFCWIWYRSDASKCHSTGTRHSKDLKLYQKQWFVIRVENNSFFFHRSKKNTSEKNILLSFRLLGNSHCCQAPAEIDDGGPAEIVKLGIAYLIRSFGEFTSCGVV